MKIGILTFSAALNHGAQLQAFALKKTLESFGHDVEIINYAPLYLKQPYRYLYRFNSRRSILSFLKQVIATILDTPKWILSRYKHTRFHKMYYSFSGSEFSCIEKMPNYYDCIVVGSDQVWNPEFSGVFDDVFFLKGVNLKKVSYAASFTIETLPEGGLEYIAESIKDFSLVSVREENLRLALQPLCKQIIIKTIDPTFLLDKNQWLKYIPQKRSIKGKYLAIFQARGEKSICEDVAKKIANKIGVTRIVNLSCTSYDIINHNKTDISPLEFVELIANSEYVVSLSFHGVAFSILMEIPFSYICLNDGRNGRIIDLLQTLNLSSRLVYDSNEINYTTIDYSSVRSKVEEIKKDSIEFLKLI